MGVLCGRSNKNSLLRGSCPDGRCFLGLLNALSKHFLVNRNRCVLVLVLGSALTADASYGLLKALSKHFLVSRNNCVPVLELG